MFLWLKALQLYITWFITHHIEVLRELFGFATQFWPGWVFRRTFPLNIISISIKIAICSIVFPRDIPSNMPRAFLFPAAYHADYFGRICILRSKRKGISNQAHWFLNYSRRYVCRCRTPDKPLITASRFFTIQNLSFSEVFHLLTLLFEATCLLPRKSRLFIFPWWISHLIYKILAALRANRFLMMYDEPALQRDSSS